jgi:DNA mismatch endonuclease, patch repair protein
VPIVPTRTPSEIRSANMRAIRSKNTKPEMIVRKALFAAGYRYRLHVRDLPGRPDLVFPKLNAILEVRGCFWHGHSCADGHIPKSNADYWTQKLASNKIRDVKNLRRLRRMGYRVKVIWECQLSSSEQAARTVSSIVKWLRSP